MVTILQPLMALFAAAILLMLGNGVLATSLSIRMELQHVEEFVIGFVMAVYSLGFLFSAYICPIIIRQVGHIRAYAVFASLATACILLHVIWPSPIAWCFLRLITGVVVMGLYMVIESWINTRSESHNRGRVFSVYQICCLLGLAFSQFLLLIYSPQDDHIFLVIGCFFVLSLVPVCLTRTEHPQMVEHQPYGVRQMFKDAPLALIGCFGAGVSNNIFYVLAPVFAVQHQLPISEISLFIGFTILSGFLWQLPVGSWSDKYDRLNVLFLLYLGLAVFSIVLPLLMVMGGTHWLWASCILQSVMFTFYAVSVAHANDHIPARHVTQISATSLLAYGMGAFVGPIVASSLMTLFGSYALYYFTGGVSLVIALVVWLFKESYRTKVEEQLPFVAVGRSSPVISELDPRAAE